MELFDVYNSNREKLNYTKERNTLLLQEEYNVGVEIWIFNNHKLLITKRSINKSHPLEWEVPGGCSLANEESQETLIREIQEEIGLNLTNKDFKLITTTLYKHQFVDIYISNIKVDLTKLKLQTQEVSDIKFVTKKEFLTITSDKKIVLSVFERYNLIKDYISKYW